MRRFYLILIPALLGLCAGLQAQTDSLSNVFNRVRGSVVVIRLKQQVPVANQRLVTTGSIGSGFLISEDGKILTAAHVVQTAFDVEVVFASGEVVPAEILGSEPAADVALIKVARVPKGAVVARMADSDLAMVGDRVFIVGAPYGLSYTFTSGYISARHRPSRMAGDMELAEFFQTDAAINQGNSGGPMFNLNGEVVGIVSHILSQSGGFEGLGFVASIKTAKELLLDQPSFWGGMEGFVLEGALANIFNLPQKRGTLVQRVAPGSPAEWLGLRGSTIPAQIGDQKFFMGGDILLAVGGISFAEEDSYARIRQYLNGLKKGDVLSVTILRAGVTRTLQNRIDR